MNRITRRSIVGVVLAAAALSVPVAANADTIYPPTGSCTVTPATVTPGGTLELSCLPATFSSDEPVTITVTGENGAAASVGFVKFAISTASGVVESNADGSLTATRIILPSDATGTYNIAAISATSAGGTATSTIAVPTGADGLPATGINGDSLLGLWVGGGALLLAGGAVAVGATIRRQRRAQS